MIILTISQLFNLPILNLVIILSSLLFLLKASFSKDSTSIFKSANLQDISMLIFLMVEMVALAWSTDKSNSVFSFIDVAFLWLFYFLVRIGMQRQEQRILFFIFATLLASILTGLTIYKFFPQYSKLVSLGLTDFSNFKRLIHLPNPLDLVTGEWVTIFILLLSFPFILFLKYQTVHLTQNLQTPIAPKKSFNAPKYFNRRNHKHHSVLLHTIGFLRRWLRKIKSANMLRTEILSWLLVIPILAILIAGLIILSRAVLLAFASFFLISSLLFVFYKIIPLKKILIFTSGLLLLLMLCLIPLLPSLWTTVALFKTTSQVRSIEGRSNVWEQSLEIVKAHPFFGVGSNNFALAYLPYKSQEDDARFIGSAYNTFLQVLVEKGIFGFLAYGFLFFAFFKVSFNKIKLVRLDIFKSASLILFTAAIAAVIIRDLTYSSIFVNKAASVLMWFMFAHNAGLSDRTNTPDEPKAKSWSGLILLLIPTLIVFIWGSYKYLPVQRAAYRYQSYADNLVKKDYAAAETAISQAITLSPDEALLYASRGLLQFKTIQPTFHLKQLFSRDTVFSQEDVNRIESAIQTYQKAIAISPNDDGFYHNLGWLYFFSQDKQQALDNVRKAITLDSTQAMYHVSLGLIQEHYGETEEAFKEYQTAIRLSPGIIDSQFFIDLKTRSPNQANEIVANVILELENKARQDSSPLLTARLGKLYLYKKSLDQAEKLLRDALRETPGLSRPWFNQGQIFEMQYNEDEMKRCYEIADYLDADEVLPAIRLGDFYDRHNQIPQAVFYYRKGVDRWVGQSSLHTRETLRLYNAKVVVRNDVIPEELLYYYRPTFDLAGTCMKLSIFYQHNGNENLANYYEEIGKRFSS